jgi:hypothetical protein
MTLRTGSSSTGATYRYYTCSTNARQDKIGCEGRTIPMNKLDHIVANHLEGRLLPPSGSKPSSPASSTAGWSAPSVAANIWPNFTGGSPKSISGAAVSTTLSNPAWSIRTMW